MNRLLKDQKIRIDAHQRGAGERIGWDESANDIHVDKTQNRKVHGQDISVHIRIPINSDRNITVEIPKRTRDKDAAVVTAENQLVREIHEVLSDRKARQAFIDDILEILDNYPTAMSSAERGRTVVKRLSRHFGLPANITRELSDYVDQRYFTAFYTVPQGTFYVSLNDDAIEAGQLPTGRIRLGRNRGNFRR